jgi:hypothetical protein
MHTGPFSKLVPGTYEAKFVLRPANHTPSIAGAVEIGESSGRSVWSQNFLGADGRLQVIQHEFNVLASDGLFQSRVSIAGIVGVYLWSYGRTRGHAMTRPPGRGTTRDWSI